MGRGAPPPSPTFPLRVRQAPHSSRWTSVIIPPPPPPPPPKAGDRGVQAHAKNGRNWEVRGMCFPETWIRTAVRLWSWRALILRRAIWVMIPEQGHWHPFVNRTFEWGAVTATFLSVLRPTSPKIEGNRCGANPPKAIPLPLRRLRLRRTGGVSTGPVLNTSAPHPNNGGAAQTRAPRPQGSQAHGTASQTAPKATLAKMSHQFRGRADGRR